VFPGRDTSHAYIFNEAGINSGLNPTITKRMIVRVEPLPNAAFASETCRKRLLMLFYGLQRRFLGTERENNPYTNRP
jgi:hypothetical protein